jgi:hypothetical protein
MRQLDAKADQKSVPNRVHPMPFYRRLHQANVQDKATQGVPLRGVHADQKTIDQIRAASSSCTCVALVS